MEASTGGDGTSAAIRFDADSRFDGPVMLRWNGAVAGSTRRVSAGPAIAESWLAVDAMGGGSAGAEHVLRRDRRVEVHDV